MLRSVSFELSTLLPSFLTPALCLVQLFRNLWFYIALLGLGPPLPGASSSVPRALTKGTAKLVNTSMQAVTGPYAFPPAWIQAVETIAEGTPPLVVSWQNASLDWCVLKRRKR
jgi:hypothetical protein